MADIISIVSELADEIRAGGDVEKLYGEYAQEYGIREETIRARFARAYPNGVPAAVDMAAKVRVAVEEACRRYAVPASATRTGVDSHGKRYTLIGRLNSRQAVAVDHETARVWYSPITRFVAASKMGLI